MEIYKYKNYEEYTQIQINGNKAKIENIWAEKNEIKLISKYIKKNIPDIRFGICHGTRNGAEIMWFRNFLGVKVIGTFCNTVGFSRS